MFSLRYPSGQLGAAEAARSDRQTSLHFGTEPCRQALRFSSRSQHREHKQVARHNNDSAQSGLQKAAKARRPDTRAKELNDTGAGMPLALGGGGYGGTGRTTRQSSEADAGVTDG